METTTLNRLTAGVESLTQLLESTVDPLTGTVRVSLTEAL